MKDMLTDLLIQDLKDKGIPDNEIEIAMIMLGKNPIEARYFSAQDQIIMNTMGGIF